MQPRYSQISVPKFGFRDLESLDAGLRVCHPKFPKTRSVKAASGSFVVAVDADGPGGSGHVWTIAIGLANDAGSAPTRGVCLETSTVGWRTLQSAGPSRYQRTPLPWLEDMDGDGNAELILWDSFPIFDEPMGNQWALVAWVYQLGAGGFFRLDLDISRMLAQELMSAYRSPTDGKWVAGMRTAAAAQLEAFAAGRCTLE